MLYLVTINAIRSPVLYNTPYKIFKTKEEAQKEITIIQNELPFICHIYAFNEEDGVYKHEDLL